MLAPFLLNLANGNLIIVETNNLQADEEGEHYSTGTDLNSVQTWRTTPMGKAVTVKPETQAYVRDRMLGMLISQTVDILDRKIGEPADLELGCRLALGFKAGPLSIMQRIGDGEVSRIVAHLQRERTGLPQPRQPLGDYQKFYRHVLLDDIGDVKLITIRRPDALNAVNDEVTEEVLSRHPPLRRRHEGTRFRAYWLWPARLFGRRRYRPLSERAR